MGTTDFAGILKQPCNVCGNIMRYAAHKLGSYWTCSPCYYRMSESERDELRFQLRDWDLIRKDRDYLD